MTDYTYAQLKALWVQAGGNKLSADIAAAIAMAESGGVSTASNVNTDGSTDRGLWQINSVHGSQSTFDPLANAKAAVSISGNGKSWSPWVTFTSGAYKKFLSPTTAADASTQASTTSSLSLIPGVGNLSISGIVTGAINTVLGMLGIKRGLQDMAERFGLIILGFALVILGIHLLSGGSGGGSTVVVNEPSTKDGTSSKSSKASGDEVKTTSKKTVSKAGADTGASEAVEAAAVA